LEKEPVAGRAAIAVFLRVPEIGQVKTRIARTMGSAAALEIYESLLGQVLQVMRGRNNVYLAYTPAEKSDWVRGRMLPGWNCLPQPDGDLGEKMLGISSALFARGAGKVLLVGSDCPYLTNDDLDAAEAMLDEKRLVLGPSSDGGYWLIGMNRLMPELFSGIQWSTSGVLEQTLAKARSIGVEPALLRILSDIDEEQDWIAYQRSLQPRTNN
jgi:hypothetical protein